MPICAHLGLIGQQRTVPTGPVPEYFCSGIFALSILRQTASCVCRKSPLMVWRDLVDAVTHACRRFLRGWASQMGFPTTWKGEGRVESGKPLSIWGPSKYWILFITIQYCIPYGLLKPAYESAW